MIGFAATFHSFNKETANTTVPATTRLLTLSSSAGESSGRRHKIRMLLVQSIALSPANRGVQGLGTFKKKSKTTNPTAPKGTAKVFSSRVNGKPKANLRLTVDLEAPFPTACVSPRAAGRI